MKKMIRAEIRRIKPVKSICPRQPGKWKIGRRKKFGKTLFYKRFFVNSFYLTLFCCGVVPHNQTEFKLKFKSQKSKQICCGA